MRTNASHGGIELPFDHKMLTYLRNRIGRQDLVVIDNQMPIQICPPALGVANGGEDKTTPLKDVKLKKVG